MKIGNIAPRAGIEYLSLVFWVSVLTIIPLRLPDATPYQCPHVYVAPCLISQGRLLHLSTWNCKSFKWSFNAYNYLHTENVLALYPSYTGKVQKPYSTQLAQDHGHGTSVVRMMKTGNSAHRAGIKPTSLVFWAMVLIITPPWLPDVITLFTPTCLCGSFA